jgi:hypothetical protein
MQQVYSTTQQLPQSPSDRGIVEYRHISVKKTNHRTVAVIVPLSYREVFSDAVLETRTQSLENSS